MWGGGRGSCERVPPMTSNELVMRRVPKAPRLTYEAGAETGERRDLGLAEKTRPALLKPAGKQGTASHAGLLLAVENEATHAGPSPRPAQRAAEAVSTHTLRGSAGGFWNSHRNQRAGVLA